MNDLGKLAQLKWFRKGYLPAVLLPGKQCPPAGHILKMILFWWRHSTFSLPFLSISSSSQELSLNPFLQTGQPPGSFVVVVVTAYFELLSS
jgi:hypothetical protein